MRTLPETALCRVTARIGIRLLSAAVLAVACLPPLGGCRHESSTGGDVANPQDAAPKEDKVELYIRHAQDLFASGRKDLASRALRNARVFDRHLDDIDRLLKECPFEGGPIVLVKDGKPNKQGEQDLEYMHRFSDACDTDLIELFKMANTDRDETEVDMLLDEKLVGSARFRSLQVTADGLAITFLLFFEPPKVTVEQVLSLWPAAKDIRR